jgi:RNA polymerase subunit RPABC4/transcription elongation factor Spt4
MTSAKYKICKDCGTRNHPASGQCAACGSRLASAKDWFSMAGLILIVLIVIGLIVYSVRDNSPPGSKPSQPGIANPAE